MNERSHHPRLVTSEAIRTESRLRLLIETGLVLASATTADAIVQSTLEAGSQLSNARFGVFFDNTDRAKEGAVAEPSASETYSSWRLAGIDADSFAASRLRSFVTQRHSRFLHGESLCSQDFLNLPAEESGNPRRPGAAPRTLPDPNLVRSLLAVPVHSKSLGLFGVLLYAHPEPGALTQDAEEVVRTVAAQAALALAHVQVNDNLLRQITRADVARAGQRTTGLRLLQALEAAQLGTWSWNAATGLIDFDERAAALFGVEPHVPVPRNELRERLLNIADLHRSPVDLKAVLEGTGKYTAEYRLRLPEGAERWVAVTGNATHDPDSGRRAGMIGTLQDITPRKLQEESLRTSEKLAATGRLAATIAHEINNPLEAVTNLIYLAKTDPVTPPAIHHLLETADTELARVSQIAQQTLGFYRDTTRPISVDLNDLLKAVVGLFDRKLTGKRLRVTLDLEPGLSVVGLQGEIRQVVSNLLVNAIDACEAPGGRIRIRARSRRRDGHRGVFVIVSDQGSGIPHEVRHRLFTPFTTTKQSLGTGLGLWVTQGMVEKHGGSVRFRSRTAHPSGTVFRVYLPETGSPRLFAHQSTPVLQ